MASSTPSVLPKPLSDKALKNLAVLIESHFGPAMTEKFNALINDYKFYRDSAAQRDADVERAVDDANQWEAVARKAEASVQALREAAFEASRNLRLVLNG